jgi:hypothetical protein
MLSSRRVTLVLGIVLSFALSAHAQGTAPPFIVTASPDPSARVAATNGSATVEELGLTLLSGSTSGIGVGATVPTSGWTVRSIRSLTELPIDGRSRPTFEQAEAMRPLWSRGSTIVAAAGGVRQQWDGAPALIGRVIAAADVAGGRLEGNVLVARLVTSAIVHDAADVVTSVGWSRRSGKRISIGIDGIGQDLEGFWNPAEADGGGRLLVGPSLRARSATGAWVASVIAGPVFTSLSSTSHIGVLVSGSWVPSIRHASLSATGITHTRKEQP